jgi:hypothetical protein
MKIPMLEAWHQEDGKVLLPFSEDVSGAKRTWGCRWRSRRRLRRKLSTSRYDVKVRFIGIGRVFTD